MATNEVIDRFDSSTAFTITLASLASSTAGVGRQSTILDNTSNKYLDVLVFVKIKLGTSPTGNRAVYVYLIRDDNNGTNHRSDGAGASDAGLTIQNAQLIGTMADKQSPATGDVLYGEFLVHRPGPKWGICIVHDTGVVLDSTEGNHWVRYVGLSPDIQAAA
jgi:hypothetical protein